MTDDTHRRRRTIARRQTTPSDRRRGRRGRGDTDRDALEDAAELQEWWTRRRPTPLEEAVDRGGRGSSSRPIWSPATILEAGGRRGRGARRGGQTRTAAEVVAAEAADEVAAVEAIGEETGRRGARRGSDRGGVMEEAAAEVEESRRRAAAASEAVGRGGRSERPPSEGRSPSTAQRSVRRPGRLVRRAHLRRLREQGEDQPRVAHPHDADGGEDLRRPHPDGRRHGDQGRQEAGRPEEGLPRLPAREDDLRQRLVVRRAQHARRDGVRVGRHRHQAHAALHARGREDPRR